MQVLINLCPTGIIEKEKARKLGVLAGISVVIVLALLGGIYAHKYLDLKKLEKKVQAIDSELSKLQDVVARVEQLETQKSSLNSKLSVIKSLLSETLVYPKFIEDLLSRVPSSIWFDEFAPSRSGNTFTLTINGTSLDVFPIAEFMTILQKSGVYKQVDFQGFTVDNGDWQGKQVKLYKFRMSFAYEIQK